jgi:uncharacterized membrane protein YraQ (UPF0718 family)
MHLAVEILKTVREYLEADWQLLLFGILVAVFLDVYFDGERLRAAMSRKSGVGIMGSVAVGSLTPLCACGTMAVILSMFLSAISWGPVMAFLVSSPLTSPSEFVFESVFLGRSFALAMVASSVALGVSAGFIAAFLERRTGFFDGQFRPSSRRENSRVCSCEGLSPERPAAEKGRGFMKKLKIRALLVSFLRLGLFRILLYFVLFIALGKLVEMLVPREWVSLSFGPGHFWSIPAAALLGLPLYLTDSSALPLLRTAIEAGATPGAVLAFLIAGKGTGIPVIAGMSVILKPRVIAFYVGFIALGSVGAGYGFQLFVR